MKFLTQTRLTLLFALVFGLILTSAQASPKTFQGMPVTTQSEQAFDYYVIAQTLLDQGKTTEAQKLFKRALDKDPGFSAAWLGFAYSATSEVEYKKGVDKASAFIDKASLGEKLLLKIARTYLNDDLKNRVKFTDQLVESYPKSPRAWLIKGNALGDINNQEAQREAYSKSIVLKDDFSPAYTKMALSYIFNQPKDFVKGESYMLKASKLNPGDDSVYVNLGDAHRAMQALDMASEDYDKASLINANNAVALVKKGHVDSFIGNFESAKKAYKQALKVADTISNPYYANYSAFVNLHAAKPKVAITELGEVIKSIDRMELADHQKDSAKMFALTNQATIALHHKFVDQAKSILEQRETLMRKIAQNIKDKDFTRNQEADIAFWQGQLAARMGDFSAAQKFARANEKLVKDNNNPRKMEKYYELEGLIALLSEKFGEAKDHYSKSDQNNIYVKYHLALAMELSGEKNKAREIYKEVAQFNFNSVEYALVRKDAIAKSSI